MSDVRYFRLAFASCRSYTRSCTINWSTWIVWQLSTSVADFILTKYAYEEGRRLTQGRENVEKFGKRISVLGLLPTFRVASYKCLGSDGMQIVTAALQHAKLWYMWVCVLGNKITVILILHQFYHFWHYYWLTVRPCSGGATDIRSDICLPIYEYDTSGNQLHTHSHVQVLVCGNAIAALMNINNNNNNNLQHS